MRGSCTQFKKYAMENLTATIPHRLGRIEARRRIQEQLGELRKQHGNVLQEIKENWNGDRMDFSVSAMGQSISGNLVVQEQAVQVEVAMPWLLAMLAGTVKQQIEQQGKRMLEGPKPK